MISKWYNSKLLYCHCQYRGFVCMRIFFFARRYIRYSLLHSIMISNTYDELMLYWRYFTVGICDDLKVIQPKLTLLQIIFPPRLTHFMIVDRWWKIKKISRHSYMLPRKMVYYRTYLSVSRAMISNSLGTAHACYLVSVPRIVFIFIR